MSVYSQLLEQALLPAYNAVTGRQYARHRDFLEDSQWWPRERLLEFQWAELQKLLRHAFDSAPYYRRKYAGIRVEDIRTPEDFARLPPLTRGEVNSHREELRSDAYTGKLLPHATGGSSGVPTRFYITRESFDWRCAATQRTYAWSGCRLGERTAYLWGAPVGVPPRWKAVKMRAYRWLRRELILSTFRQSEPIWEAHFQAITRFRPDFLVGYVSSLEQFAEFLIQQQRTPPPLRAVLAAAEPVHARLRKLVENVFGAPLFETYGSREFMSIGGECERHQGLHINAENLVVETAQPAAAGPSEILITDLHNYGMPFLRYAIGDVGILEPDPCPCGRSLPRIRSIEGRVLDLLRGSDGRIVPGEFFPHLMKELPEVREFLVQQESAVRIVISVVLARELSPASRSLLEREVGNVFGNSIRLEVNPVDEIPRLASGKRRVTIGLGR